MPTLEEIVGEKGLSLEEITGTARAPRTAFQKQAAYRKANLEVEQTAAGYKQDISNAQAKFAGDISKSIPIAATLATGGMAAPLVAGVMGLSAGAAGAYEEAAKLALGATDTSGYSGLTGLGAKDAPAGGAAASPKELARRLSVDFAVGAGTQAAVSVGAGLLSLAGTNVLMPMVARAAAKVDAGKTILGQYGVNLMNKIRNLESATVGTVAPSEGTALALAGSTKIPKNVQVSIDRELATFEARLAARQTGQSDAFKARMPGLSQKLTAWDGSLSQLTEIKGDLSQMAFKKAGMNFEEVNALKEFAKGVDAKLAQKFGQIGGQELYQGFKEVQNQLFRFDAGVELAGATLHNMASRLGYAAAGGAYGYGHGGGIEGAVKGAVAGAVASVGVSAIAQRGAPWLLEKMLADKIVAPVAKQAIAGMMAGDAKAAKVLFARAASQIGADKILKSWLQEEAQMRAAGQPDVATPAP